MSPCVDDGLMQVKLRTRRSSTQSDINQVSHWYNNFPDDGHLAARNMYRVEIYIHEKLYVKFGIYKEFTSFFALLL